MRTLIITGGRFDKEFAVSFLEKNKYDYVIAVDHGLDYCKILNVIPDMIVGDFDSAYELTLVEYENQGVTVRRFQPEKDDTDTEIAIQEAVMLKSDMDILGATGGRLDHLLANIHNLKIALDGGVDARIIDECNTIYLKNKSFVIDGQACRGKYISFVPFDGVVKGLKLKGFKYSLSGYDLKPGASRCISNELIQSVGEVVFDKGCLIVINSLDVKAE